MSSGPRIQFMVAQANAREFEGLVKSTTQKFTTAGSIRRDREWVGDIEHVVIPSMQNVPKPTQTGLFGAVETSTVLVNRFLERIDALAAAGIIIPHDGEHEVEEIDTETGELKLLKPKCWGQKQRRLHFKGIRHELFLADENNYGAILTIRTGPADFSQRLMSKLNYAGNFKQKDGYLVYAAGPAKGEIVPVPTEDRYFQMCGFKGVVPPHARDTYFDKAYRR